MRDLHLTTARVRLCWLGHFRPASARFTTYAIEAPRGSRVIGVNGAAARLVQKNDKVIVVTYGQMPQEEARQWNPNVVLLDDANEIKHA